MTNPLFWLGVALGVLIAGLGLFLAARRGAPRNDSAADEPLPRTMLQTRARWGLGLGALSALLALAIVLSGDPGSILDDDSRRLAVYGALALGGVAYGGVLLATRRAHRGEVLMDERDREILARAPRVQAGAILASLLVWTIALTELYWDRGQLPIAFPFLIFLSSCLVGLLGFSAGILLGYRRP